MAQSETVTFRADESLRDGVERYQEREGIEHLSDAARQLVTVGLREQRNPIVWRFKDRVVEWINLLSISAVVVFALGAATQLYAFAQGVLGALVLLALASVLLAGFELARVMAGMNEIGVQVRHGLGALATVVGRE